MTTTNVRGRVYLRLPDGGIGDGVSGTALTFVPENHSPTYHAATDAQGNYALRLPQGRYYVRATHVDYEDYASVPGFVKVTPPVQICNFFLRAPQITTALLLRHADRQGGDDALSELGTTRARVLRDLVLRSGVTELYCSDTERARATVQPLQDALGLTAQIYGTATEAAQRILQRHAGDVSLVVAHSDSVLTVIEQLGGPARSGAVPGFDNLFVVSRHRAQVQVLRLGYGAPTGAPSALTYPPQATTVLLVGTGERAGDAPQRLRQAAARAGVSAIYASGDRTAMVTPLAQALQLEIQRYDPAELLSVVETLLAQHENETVVVSGSHQELRELLRLLRGRGPTLASSDTSHLLVLTRFASGEVRVLPLRL